MLTIGFDQKSKRKLGLKFTPIGKRLVELNESCVEAGWFSESGQHPTADMSFVDLASIYEFGFPPSRKRQPLMYIEREFRKHMDKGIQEKLSGYIKGEVKLEDLLDCIGDDLNETAYDVIGSNPPLKKFRNSNNPDTPLVDTGALADAFSWKTTAGDSLKSQEDRYGDPGDDFSDVPF